MSLWRTVKRFGLLGLLLLSGLSHAQCRDYQVHSTLDNTQLWQDIEYLASDALLGRKTQTPAAQATRQYLVERLTQLGAKFLPNAQQYTLPFRYELTLGSVEGTNVAAMIKGLRYPERYIVVSAHYDHLGNKGRKIFNGADDNASGVAALLALAKYVDINPLSHTVVFLATDAEEKGLYGAKAFLRNSDIDPTKIVLNLNLDMLARGGRTHRLHVSAAGKDILQHSVIPSAQKQAGLCLVSGHPASSRGFRARESVNWRRASDHAAFYAADIPYLFVSVGVHGDYHTENDVTANIDPEFFAAAAHASLMLLKIADDNIARQQHK